MRQAIETKWFGPTNSRGSRVKAYCDAGSVTVGWNYSLNPDANHVAAAKALASRLEWDGQWIGGSTKGSGYAFVLCGTTSGRKYEADFMVDLVTEPAV